MKSSIEYVSTENQFMSLNMLLSTALTTLNVCDIVSSTKELNHVYTIVEDTKFSNIPNATPATYPIMT